MPFTILNDTCDFSVRQFRVQTTVEQDFPQPELSVQWVAGLSCGMNSHDVVFTTHPI
jgi:hypothetical protein